METYGDIIKSLIQLYTKAINDMHQLYWKQYLTTHSMENGICFAASENLSILLDDIFVKEYTRGYLYLTKTPNRCTTREEALKTLNSRLYRLEELLPRWENEIF